jgi:REP element-mobilizing transposase RayT
MPSSYSKLYVHLVWATWDRLPLISMQIEAAVYAAILAKCRELQCQPVRIGGIPDHVHLLVRLHPNVSVSELMKNVKGSSSHLVTHQVASGEFFKWQGSYGAFSLSEADLPALCSYIEQQKEHHTSGGINQDWEKVTCD